ncbi:MAG: hypothetical protein AAB923_03320, partial [Patescibacteria group bacterium]
MADRKDMATPPGDGSGSQGDQKPSEGAPPQPGSPAAKPPKRKGNDDPDFDYRITIGYAIVILFFAVLCDILNIIPFVGIVTKIFMSILFLVAGVNPFRLWLKRGVAGRKQARKQAEEELEKRVEELEEGDSYAAGFWRVANFLFGGGIVAWVIILLFDSAPFISVFFWTTLNASLLIMQSRRLDRHKQRVRHIEALMGDEEKKEGTWRQRVTRMVRRLGSGGRGTAQRTDGGSVTRTARYLGQWSQMTPSQRAALLRRGSSFSSSTDGGMPRTFKNDAERRAYLKELEARKRRGGFGGQGLAGGRQRAQGVAAATAGMATAAGLALKGEGETDLEIEEREKRLTKTGIDGIDASVLAGKTLEELDEEEKKRLAAEAGVDGIVPDDGLEEMLADLDTDDLEREALLEAYDEHIRTGGTMPIDQYIRTISPEDLIARKRRLSQGLAPAYGAQSIDGVVGARTSVAAGLDATFATASRITEPKGLDERDYIRIQRDVQASLTPGEWDEILKSQYLSLDARNSLRRLRGGQMGDTLSDAVVDELTSDDINPRITLKLKSLRGDYPATAFKTETLRLFYQNSSLGSDVRLTAEDMAKGIPGAT